MVNRILRKLKLIIFPSSDPRNVLLSKMPKNSISVEIGSWKGDFSERILQKTHPKKLYLIDPYIYDPNYTKAWYGGVSGSQNRMDKIYESIVTRFQDEIKSNKLEIKRNFSKDALATFQDNSIDWVYIDGNHTYEFVKEDLQSSWIKVKIGGFITGDDYNLEGWWNNGVTKAVDEFIALNKASIGKTFFIGTQFIIEKIR